MALFEQRLHPPPKNRVPWLTSKPVSAARTRESLTPDKYGTNLAPLLSHRISPHANCRLQSFMAFTYSFTLAWHQVTRLDIGDQNLFWYHTFELGCCDHPPAKNCILGSSPEPASAAGAPQTFPSHEYIAYLAPLLS
jgi:hypothetical protein